MQQVVIENPILNSPYAEPVRHFKFSDEGITDEVIEARRVSSYCQLRETVFVGGKARGGTPTRSSTSSECGPSTPSSSASRSSAVACVG